MHKQRLAILICAGLGMLAIFMPWVNVPIIGSVNGTKENIGWVTFVIFAVPLGVSLAGDGAKNLVKDLMYAAAVAGVANAIIAIYKINDINSAVSSAGDDNFIAKAITSSVSAGFGLYLIAMAGFAIAIVCFILRDKPVEKTPQQTNKMPEDAV